MVTITADKTKIKQGNSRDYRKANEEYRKKKCGESEELDKLHNPDIKRK